MGGEFDAWHVVSVKFCDREFHVIDYIRNYEIPKSSDEFDEVIIGSWKYYSLVYSIFFRSPNQITQISLH